MDRRFLETVARQMGSGRSRREVLGTATKGALGGLGAALFSRGAGAAPVGGRAAFAVRAQAAAVVVKDFEFDPGSIEVPVGATVTWTNQGPSSHTVTSDDGGATFNSGTLDPGKTFDHTFDKEGTFAYHCNFHSEMHGTVVVKAATPTPTTYVRRNLHGLDASELKAFTDAYATAVDKMKKLPKTDQRSWYYQAHIHQFPFEEFPELGDPNLLTIAKFKAFLETPGHEGWFTCEHSSQTSFTSFFWPWHRMYLYWFERIVRDQSGDPTFALPYWDYSDPAQRVLPAPFRELGNPLFVDLRDPDVNNGIAPCFITSTNPTCAAGLIAGHSEREIFGNCSRTGETTFGISEPTFDLASGDLEGSPHGSVHLWVGGNYANPQVSGLMASIPTAAQDPVFWLHHANIDRLWESWLSTSAQPHVNPPGTWRDNKVNSDWGFDIPYVFFDEAVNKMTTIPLVKDDGTLADLGYSYEKLFDPDAAMCNLAPVVEVLPPATPPTNTAPEELGSTSGTPAPVGGIAAGPDPGSVSVALTQPGDGPEAVARGGTVVLSLEGVMGQVVPATSFEVYVDLPEGETPDPNDIFFAGYLILFGMQPSDNHLVGVHHGVRRFNISQNVAALKAGGYWTPELTVTIVPRYGLPAQPEAAGATPVSLPPGPWVTVESVSVSTQ